MGNSTGRPPRTKSTRSGPRIGLASKGSRETAGCASSVRRSHAQSLAGGRQPPACAGNVLRRDLDMFFEAHQLPVSGTVREGEAGFAGEADHDVVGAQRIAEQVFGAKRRGA